MDSVQRQQLIIALINQRIDEDLGDPLPGEVDDDWEEEAKRIKTLYRETLENLGNADLWACAEVKAQKELSRFLERWT